MVYHGPSRGCNSCKQRRKKCDAARPSCMRCIRAHRACGGYEDPGYSSFKFYEMQDAGQSTRFATIARKCTMPKRVPLPGTNIVPEDTLPTETSQAESDTLSLRAFVYDYCIVSTNANLSRSYLPGLEMLAYRLGPQSNLVRACQAVSFATHGKPLNRPKLVEKSELLHHELLGSFATALQTASSKSATETRFIAQLLGLHSLAASNRTDPRNHTLHAHGVAALLGGGSVPFNLLKPEVRCGVFSTPTFMNSDDDLGDLLFDLNNLWAMFKEKGTKRDVHGMRAEALVLDRRFIYWGRSRPTEFKSTSIGSIGPVVTVRGFSVGHWPGRIDTYFDLYVASMWNVFRTARLLLLSLIISLSDFDSSIDCANEARCILDEMLASVPYHLTDNLQTFVGNISNTTEITDTGRYLGGLLLMHPLYIASEIAFLPEDSRQYMRDCLAWIGTNMGFGHATLLTNTPGVDREYIESAIMIIWSGFLQ